MSIKPTIEVQEMQWIACKIKQILQETRTPGPPYIGAGLTISHKQYQFSSDSS